MRAGFNKWWLLPPGILAISAVVAVGIILEWSQASNNALITDCSGPLATDYACYQQRYEDLARTSGAETAFAKLKDEYANNIFVRANCHQLTHVIGRTSADLYGDLPATYSHGDSFCWSGYYHGAMETFAARIGPENILQEAPAICSELGEERGIYSFYHHNCVHGLGHGFMSIQDNELFESLRTCDVFMYTQERESCYGGVFMENLMAENNPSHPSKYLKADRPLYPCTDVESRYKHACYKMQTSYALQIQGGDLAQVFNLCATEAEDDFRPACYDSVGRDAAALTNNDVDKTKSACMLGEDHEARSNCIMGAARAFISYYHNDLEAKGLCASLAADLRDVCFRTAENYYRTFFT